VFSKLAFIVKRFRVFVRRFIKKGNLLYLLVRRQIPGHAIDALLEVVDDRRIAGRDRPRRGLRDLTGAGVGTARASRVRDDERHREAFSHFRSRSPVQPLGIDLIRFSDPGWGAIYFPGLWS
jgi:hypothetical protein